mgnify:FL=1
MRHKQNLFFAQIFIFVNIFFISLNAQTRRAPQSEDIYKIKTISNPHANSRGIIFVSSTQSEKKQKNISHLWFLGEGENKARQITFGEHSNYNPQFLPDGNRIIFISDRTDKAEIYIIDLRGGKEKKFINTNDEVSDFTLSRDGKFVALVLINYPQGDKLKILEKNKKEIKDEDIIVVDRSNYMRDGEGIIQGKREKLWLANLSNGNFLQLTDGEFDVANPEFSADGKNIFFQTNLKEAGITYNTDIFSISIDSKEIKQLTTNPATDLCASVSPDGKSIAYFAAERPKCYYDHLRLWIMRTDGTERKCLTEELDRSISFDEPQKAIWSEDGKKIFTLIEDQASVRLAEITIANKQIRFLSNVGNLVHSFEIINNRAFTISTDLSHPTEIYETDLNKNEKKQITHFNNDWLNSVELAKTQKFNFESSPGINIEGWIFFPPSIKKEEKLPGILRIHGGPQWFYGSDFSLDFHIYATSGYALFFSNPRGSTTYGAKFSDAIRGEWGNKDYHDLMSTTNYVIKNFPQVDSTRLGIMGWSYGGIMTAWITSHTQKFKAAVCGAPVVDYTADYGETDAHIDSDYEFFGPPWEESERYRKWSPLTYVADVKTPTLLAHGEEDFRCRITNSERWYISLKRLGVETIFFRYPGEPHSPTRPAHNIHFDNESLKWFDKFLK